VATDAGGNPTIIPFGEAGDVVHGDGSVGPPPPPGGGGGGGGTNVTGRVSGGQVIWESGYTYRVSAAVYYIAGTLYASAEQTITLSAPDGTFDRIDVIVLDTAGIVGAVEGVPSATPSEPSVDPATQLKLGLVLVSTGTTEPVDLSNELVYADNVGSPTEWDWTATGASINVNSSSTPHAGTKDIEGTNVVVGTAAVGTIGAGTIDPNAYDFLACFLRPKAAWANNRGLLVSLRSSGVLVGVALQIKRSGSFGYDGTLLAYQQVAIPITAFAVPAGTLIDGVRFEAYGGVVGWHLDTIGFQGQATEPATGGITQAEADARYAPLGPAFVTIGAVAGLPNERRLTAGTGVTVTDNGANNTVVVAVTPGVGVGDVVGPASSTDNAIARFDLATGKLIQNSAPIVQDDGRISTVTDPSSAQDAATKNYVDGLMANIGKRARVRLATTGPITISTGLNAGDSIDSVTLVTGDLVLVKDQAAPEQNGVYVVGVSPARFAEFDTYDEHPGSLIAAQEGTTNADTLWLCTSNVGGTLNTTAIAFSALSISAGINQLTGHGTAGPGSGSQPFTLSVAMRTRIVIFPLAGAGAGVDLVPGQKFTFPEIPYTGTITKARIVSPDVGDIELDVLLSTYAAFPTMASIVGGAPPTLSGVQKSEDSTLTGWSPAVTAGDVADVEVLTCSGIKRCTLSLTVVLT